MGADESELHGLTGIHLLLHIRRKQGQFGFSFLGDLVKFGKDGRYVLV